MSSKLRDLHPLKAQTEEELAVLDKRLQDASGIQQESDSIRVRLEEMIHRVGWSVAQGDKEVSAGKLVESLSELVSLVQQAAGLDWTESPVSIHGLARYCHEARISSEKAAPGIARLELLRKNQKALADAIKRGREALDLAEQAKRLIDAGVPERVVERNKLQRTVATYSGWLVGFDASALGALSSADLSMPVAVCHEAAVSKRTAAQASLAAAKSEYANYSKLRDQSLNLAQELRQVAARILRSSAKPDECPLCHTKFRPGELAKHINVGVDEHLEALGQTLLTRVREQEGTVHDAGAVETASAWLMKFCERASLAANMSVHSVVAEVQNTMRKLADAQVRLNALNSEVVALESQGLSVSKMEEISTRLDSWGTPSQNPRERPWTGCSRPSIRMWRLHPGLLKPRESMPRSYNRHLKQLWVRRRSVHRTLRRRYRD